MPDHLFSTAVAFGQPFALVLLLLLPLAGAVALAGSPRATRGRRIAAVGLRCLVLTSLVFALSGARLTRASDRLAVVFLVDASDSVGADGLARAEDMVNRAIAAMPDGDRAATVLFGADAVVERAMGEDNRAEPFRSRPTATATDIAGAVRLGLALFPEGASRRLVVISDGEENRGDLEAAAMMAAANDAQIVTVGLTPPDGPEVLVADVVAPARARAGDTFDVQVRVESARETPGTLRLLGDGAVLKEEAVQLRAGVNTFAVAVAVGDRGFRTFTASVSTPDGADTAFQNNQLSAFTDVAGPASALLLEGTPGEADALAAALRAGGLLVETKPAAGAPSDLPAYAGYDAVVLVNVPAQTLGRAMTTLQQYVRDLGRGLVAVGGDASFGVGGYFDTPLEETLPLRMDLRDPKKMPQVSVDFTIDKSGSMGRCHGEEGNGQARIEAGLPKTDLAKEAAFQAISMLGPSDEVGVVAFDDEAVQILPLAAISEQGDIAGALAAIKPEGGTNIYAGLAEAVEAMRGATGKVRHIILVTDGWSNTGDFDALLAEMKANGITLTVIGAGGGAADFLQDLAERGGGRFYAAADPHEIPGIFLKETKVALRAYIVEGDISLARGAPSPILDGIAALPNLQGYVSTTPKATAQTVLLSDRAEPILAQWQYGLGRGVAFTADAKNQWASGWVGWDGFARFWTQTVRWAAAGPGGDVGVTLDRNGPDGGTAITVDSADPSGAFRNDLLTTVSVLGPNGTRQDLSLAQDAPGRYTGATGELPPGAYLLAVTQREIADGPVVAGATSGLVVGYSPEYGPSHGTGPATLERARNLTGGAALDAGTITDAFRHDLAPAKTQYPLWPWLVLLALVLLPVDVAVRRLAIGRRELAGLRARLIPSRARTVAPAQRRPAHTAPLLKIRETRRPAARDPAPDADADARAGAGPGANHSPPGPAEPPQPAAPAGPSAGVRSELLAAKRRAMGRRTE